MSQLASHMLGQPNTFLARVRFVLPSCGHGFCGRCLLSAASTAHAKWPAGREIEIQHLNE